MQEEFFVELKLKREQGYINLCTPIFSCMESIGIYPCLESYFLDLINQDFSEITVFVLIRDEYMVIHILFLSR